MLKIDPNFIKNELKVLLKVQQMKQRGRRSAIKHVNAMIKEVEKLKETNPVIEVLYSSWLSITIVVKKNTDKWRVCVNFMSLNRACPKDYFPLSNIDQLVGSTLGYTRMSFLYTFQGYHQIVMHEPD